MALIEEADGSSALAFGVGEVAAALVVEGDERALGTRDLDRDAVLEPDVEGQEADTAASELGDGLAGVGVEDAIETCLAHRASGAVLVEVDVSQAGGHKVLRGQFSLYHSAPLQSRVASSEQIHRDQLAGRGQEIADAGMWVLEVLLVDDDGA